MDNAFSWQRFMRIAGVLESLGYLVAVFGPIIGIAMLVLGWGMIRWVGLGLILASILIAAYHLSFSMLMIAVQNLTRHVELLERGHSDLPEQPMETPPRIPSTVAGPTL